MKITKKLLVLRQRRIRLGRRFLSGVVEASGAGKPRIEAYPVKQIKKYGILFLSGVPPQFTTT